MQFQTGNPDSLTEFEADTLCAAKSSDENWYRATIISSNENEAKVQFTDYGNSETLPKAELKKLDSQFYEPCALALVASLGLVALQEDTLKNLRDWVTDKEVQVTLAFGDDGWLASLHLDGVDLSMTLVNEKLATPQIHSPDEQKIETTADEPISIPVGCIQVYISHIDTPGHFWLQMLDKSDILAKIQAELRENAESYPDIENREMGTLCVAKYIADDQWYRAEILDSDSDITTVRFIDYGNTDVLDNQPGLLKEMPSHLKEVDRIAIKSSVNAIPTGTGQWSEPASEYFTKLVGDLSVPVDVLVVLKDIMTYVDIFVNGQNLTDKLVSEGHATRSEETECGDLPSCFASHVNSPSEFWIQLETATPELQAMEAAMVDAENFPELSDREEGVICAAKYPEDGAWYRAQVIVDGSEGTEVLFMDYGNASIANELRSLPDELKVKPALSRKCALQKPRDVKSWSRKSEVKFNELAAEGATIFNIQFIAAGDISIVELYLDGKSVTEELVGLCEEIPTTERPTPVGQDLHSSGKVCFVNSLDEFYVQLDESASVLDKITQELYDCPQFDEVSDLKVGSVCAAFWAEDEQWYRGRVLEFCDIGYHVQFIDYGNKAKCDKFKQLPERLSVIEPIAKCCRLAGFNDTDISCETAKAKLDELASQDSRTFQIEFLDSLKEPTLVKLLLNGQDVCSIIITESKKNIENDNATSENTEQVPNVISDENNKKAEENINSVEQEELNKSQQDLNVSIESGHTVIENKSIEDISDTSDLNQSGTSTQKNEAQDIKENSDESLNTENDKSSDKTDIDNDVSKSSTPEKQVEIKDEEPIEKSKTIEESK